MIIFRTKIFIRKNMDNNILKRRNINKDEDKI